MKSTVSLFFLIVFIIIQFQATNLLGCTIFSISDSTHSFMGNSEDYWEEGYMSTIPNNSDGFGRITFSFDDKYTQGGINEYGLAIDGTGAINEMDMTINPSLPNLSLKENIIEMILKKCRNTDEAINLCRNYNLLVLKYCHIMFTDSGGKSVIVVLDKDGHTQYLIKEGNYQLITNFNPLNPTVGYYPCERYDTAITMLPHLAANEWNASTVLNAVKQAGGKETHYGQVYNCKDKEFYLFRNQDYTQALVFNIYELLKGNGHRTKLDKFPRLELFCHPIENAKLTTNNNTISFKTSDGDYKLIMAKSENFENPIIYEITFYKDINASLSIFFLIFLILLIPKTKLKLTPLVLLFFLFISCEKDLNSLFVNKMENKNYRVQINAPESGKWFWKIEGKTDSGYTISTKPLCFTNE